MAAKPAGSKADRMIAALDGFSAGPDDYGAEADLYDLTKGFDRLPPADKARVVPAMFRLMERCPDADLGDPGPLVHAIEELGAGAYEPLLVDSLRRRPMYLSVWMVNRILNVEPAGPRRESLLGLLREARDNPKYPDAAAEAARFLEDQAGEDP
ncbi:MAG TPA: hypothetical protein VEA69_09135 [Tepidisphaeraceae bacterium]|nr:hypothetical protein [Tepidisphaeraceae bacterium]